MISQSDIPGRLRLLRYGLIVLVVVTFLVALLAPYGATAPVVAAAREQGLVIDAIQITDFLGTALLYTVVVAILAVAIYFGYRMLLTRTPSK